MLCINCSPFGILVIKGSCNLQYRLTVMCLNCLRIPKFI